MPFPRWLAQTNRVVANPLLVRLASRPPLAAIRHTGRSTGTMYRTPVLTYRSGSDFVIALTYGRHADWVRNVLAAGNAVLEHGGLAHVVRDPRVTGDPSLAAIFPIWARTLLRLLRVDQYLVLEEVSQ